MNISIYDKIHTAAMCTILTQKLKRASNSIEKAEEIQNLDLNRVP